MSNQERKPEDMSVQGGSAGASSTAADSSAGNDLRHPEVMGARHGADGGKRDQAGESTRPESSPGVGDSQPTGEVDRQAGDRKDSDATDEKPGAADSAGETRPDEGAGGSQQQANAANGATAEQARQDESADADPAEQIKTLTAQLAELKDMYLRKSADFENFRKRMQREKEDSIAFANRQLLLDIVPIIDDFERAIRSAEESKDFDAFHDGIVLIEKQFTGMLERKWGLQRFESVGEVFDPQRHEAVTTETVEDHDTSVVLEDYQKGYMLHDKVLRSAKVKVSLPPPNA